jgi:hypothetical protein
MNYGIFNCLIDAVCNYKLNLAFLFRPKAISPFNFTFDIFIIFKFKEPLSLNVLASQSLSRSHKKSLKSQSVLIVRAISYRAILFQVIKNQRYSI